jgi:hypothetical protein
MVKVMVRATLEDWPREPSPEKVLRPLGAEIVAGRRVNRTVRGKSAARGTASPAAAFFLAKGDAAP